MERHRIERVLDIKARVGEGPAWSVEARALFWVDIPGCTINRFEPASGANHAWLLPSAPGSFALRKGNGAVIAARDGIYDVSFATGTIERLFDPPYDPATHRFNDGKPDRQGRFWVGTFTEEFFRTRVENQGVLYRIDRDGPVAGIRPITMANGTAFSPDGRTMYRAESFHRTILALDYDIRTGTPSGERLFARVPDHLGLPDGATVDTGGGYWVALPLGPNGGSIARYTPGGVLDVLIEMPVRMPTMVAFGGDDLATLYVTSGGESLSAGEPLGEQAGDIFAIRTGFKGIAETLVADLRARSGD